MKTTTTFLFLAFSFMSLSQSQMELNLKASENLKASDIELNQVYSKVLKKYKSDSIFISALKKTQRLWITFRDAELEMKFPAENKQMYYGSIYPMCVSEFLKEMTDTRTEKLRSYLIGQEEGDACQGAIHIFQTIDKTNIKKATVLKDSTLWLHADIKKDYRIFGFKDKNLASKKVILFSVFTKEVHDNPFILKYGAYYDTNGMNDISLKYLSIDSEFIKTAVIKNGATIDIIYFEKNWIDFEN